MMVFSKAKLVFLAMPKTGTTAYEAALEPLATLILRDPPELKHAPVFRYNRFFRPMIEKFMGDDFDVLAVMREPESWLGSWYRYRSRPALDGHRNSTRDISFDEFVSAYMKGDKPAFASVGSQAKFLEPQRNGTAVTRLFRYEDQAGLRSFLEARLDTRFETAQLNRSPAMPLLLSDKTRARFRRKCAEEFALYESIGPDGAYTPPAPAPKPG